MMEVENDEVDDLMEVENGDADDWMTEVENDD